MKVNFSFRHLDASEAVKDHALNKLARLERFESREMAVEAIFSTTRHTRTAEFRVDGGNGTLILSETKPDLYAAIDVAIDKLDRQLSRDKARRKHHRVPRRRVFEYVQ